MRPFAKISCQDKQDARYISSKTGAHVHQATTSASLAWSTVTAVISARFLTRPQDSPSGVSAGHSTPHWLGCRLRGPLTCSVSHCVALRTRFWVSKHGDGYGGKAPMLEFVWLHKTRNKHVLRPALGH